MGEPLRGQDSQRQVDKRNQAVAALLDATAAILSEVPTVDAPLSEISKRAGVNSAMVKYYFGDKEGLLLALLDKVAEKEMTLLSDLLAMDLPANRKLEIHIRGILNAFHTSPYLNRLIHYLADRNRPGARDRVIQAFIGPLVKAYQSIIAQGTREGSLRAVDPILLYYAVLGAAEHLFSGSYALPETLGMEEASSDLLRDYANLISGIFLRGLRP